MTSNTSMSLNMVNRRTTHRNKVVTNSMLLTQLSRAREQASRKVENMTTNLTSGILAKANASMYSGGVASMTVTNKGSNYKFPPLVSFEDNFQQATALAVVINKQITSITVTHGGRGYINPIISFSEDTIDIAIVQANIIGGVIQSIDVLSSGNLYLTIPKVIISDNNIAKATATLNSKGEVESISVKESGRNYTIIPIITIASPSDPPTLIQKEELYNIFLNDFLKGIQKPFNIFPTKLQKTSSSSVITNPLWIEGASNISTPPPLIRHCPTAPLITDENSGNSSSLINSGKSPNFTHTTRIDRNNKTNYILNKARESLQKTIDNIVLEGGNGAIIQGTISPTFGTLTGITIVDGGQYYTTNPPTVLVSRTDDDPGKAKAIITLDINGFIDTTTVTNPSTNIGYSQSTLPNIYIQGILVSTNMVVNGGRLTQITINSNDTSYGAPPTVVIERTLNDPGKANATVAVVDINGSITSITITNAGSGYNNNFPPIITVSGGRGQVNNSQKQALLDNFLTGAYDYIQPSSISDTIKSYNYSTNNSFSIVETNRSLHIVDVNDPLTRKQRQKYINKNIIIDTKAQEAALSRYNKAREDGIIPDVDPIPGPPILPEVIISGGNSGSGAVINVDVGSDGSISSLNVFNRGSNYPISPPTINFTPQISDPGFGASANTVIVNNKIESIPIIFSGHDYFTAPDVELENGGGSGCILTSTVDPVSLKVTNITVSNPGSNYLSVDLQGGGGSGFKGQIVTVNGVITSVIVQDSGSGYNVQQPSNSIYLEYLKEALVRSEVIRAQEPILPESTLENNLHNLSIRSLNEQKIASARASSDVINNARVLRSRFKQAHNIWLQDESDITNKETAQKLYTQADKMTAAAHDLKKYVPTDNIKQYKNKLFP